MSVPESIMKTAARIDLVSARPEHAALLHAILTGPNTRKYSPVGRTTVPELARRLALGGTLFSERAPFYRFFGGIDGALFGTCIVKNIDWEKREAEIGFSLLDEWQGRGLGSALVHKCTALVFAESVIDSLWATASVTNEASRRLMRRVGFEECGLYERDFLIGGKPVAQMVYRISTHPPPTKIAGSKK